MDSEEIDDKISEVGMEVFQQTTREWLTKVVTNYHYKTNLGLYSSEVMAKQNLEDEDLKSSSSTLLNDSITHQDLLGQPPLQITGDNKSDEMVKYNFNSNEVLESPSVEILMYTLGHVVSNRTLVIPPQTTILNFDVTYTYKPNSRLKQEPENIFTKSLIVKLIDDESGFDDYEDELGEKETSSLQSNSSILRDKILYNPALCEINFYTKIVPEIELWASSRGVPFKFGIPTCIYGNYIPGAHSRKSPLILSSLSTLVLEGLVENDGYLMNNPGVEGLEFEELKLAIIEISKIHAVSWAFQECTGESLNDKYKNYFEDLEDLSANFAEDIEDSFQEVEAFLEERGDEKSRELLEKLRTSLLPNIEERIKELLIQSDPINKPVTCIVHCNYWHQNILYKAKQAKVGEENNSSCQKTDCRILDWESVAITQPMIDIACILFRSATPATRHEKIHEFLELYTNTFRATAQCLNIPTVLDLNCFKSQYQKCSLFPILMMMGTMALTLCDDTAMELFMEGLIDLEADDLL